MSETKSDEQHLARIFHTSDAGAPACCRLTWSEWSKPERRHVAGLRGPNGQAGAPACCRLTWSKWSKPASCRRSGPSAFCAGYEMPGLDTTTKKKETSALAWRVGVRNGCPRQNSGPGRGPAARSKLRKNRAQGRLASVLLETGQSDDCNLMRHNRTTDRVTNTGPTGARRAWVSGLTGGVPQ
jgi:hypothetical protein